MDNRIKEEYGFDSRLTNILDDLQIEYGCCGGSNFSVYNASRWANEESRISARNGPVPDSCCIRNRTGEIASTFSCHGVDLISADSIYVRGCFSVIEEGADSILRGIAGASFCLGTIWVPLRSACFGTARRNTVSNAALENNCDREE
ncbi:unnamed protein product [Mesocestoides corti]|uniref:Tetraspanin n=1 Tax=Mesocestoides corti TaxID=53468 RepID=A0A0R3U4J5_MESCO|nr:unnamed protein product [Mesocestoides corti]